MGYGMEFSVVVTGLNWSGLDSRHARSNSVSWRRVTLVN
jgi:hypothetical protein